MTEIACGQMICRSANEYHIAEFSDCGHGGLVPCKSIAGSLTISLREMHEENPTNILL